MARCVSTGTCTYIHTIMTRSRSRNHDHDTIIMLDHDVWTGWTMFKYSWFQVACTIAGSEQPNWPIKCKLYRNVTEYGEFHWSVWFFSFSHNGTSSLKLTVPTTIESLPPPHQLEPVCTRCSWRLGLDTQEVPLLFTSMYICMFLCTFKWRNTS